MSERLTSLVAVYLVLIKDEKVLLARRANTGYRDGFYSLPSGHVDKGENASEAMVREAAEEIGINVSKENLKPLTTVFRDTNSDRIYVDFYFTASVWQGQVKNCEPDKCDDLLWSDLNSLPENIIPDVKAAILTLKNPTIFMELGWQPHEN